MSTESSGSATFLRFFRASLVMAVVLYMGYTVYGNYHNDNSAHPFKLGLDLAGGSHLVYEADASGVARSEVPELMNVLREVIERRINIFGVSEPVVYVESSSIVSDVQSDRLIVELPGVTNVEDAVAEIGRTPLLEFKLIDQDKQRQVDELRVSTGTDPAQLEAALLAIGEPYIDTGLTGRYLESARLEFSGGNQGGKLSNEPVVSIRFSSEGAALFADITRQNIGELLAIFLDGEILSAPRINETISGGTAIISGGFNPEEARALAQNLSFGALPLPIELVSTQTVGATLGQEVLKHSVKAGLVGLCVVILFMIIWYRLPGVIAGVALAFYIVVMLALFQYIPVTLTAAGLAGFIISLGMAVDANVLVFERLKEELRSGARLHVAAREGFTRAWGAIRDGNITSLLSAVILYWFGTALVKGFALVFGVGIIMSMISALLVTRLFLFTLPDKPKMGNRIWSFLLGSGLSK